MTQNSNRQALEALDIIQTDFCMGIDNRAISDEGIDKQLEIIRAALSGSTVNGELLEQAKYLVSITEAKLTVTQHDLSGIKAAIANAEAHPKQEIEGVDDCRF